MSLSCENSALSGAEKLETLISIGERQCQEILAQIGYGPKFSLLSTAQVAEDGSWGRGTFEVPEAKEREFLRDHLVANPMMPGVVQLEAAAQLCVIVGSQADKYLASQEVVDQNVKPDKKELRPLLTGVLGNLGTIVLPGATLQIEVHKLSEKHRSQLWSFSIVSGEDESTGLLKAEKVLAALFARKYRREQSKLFSSAKNRQPELPF